MIFPLVYLTGIPASGKTTVVGKVKAVMPTVAVLEYSVLIAEHLAKKHRREVTHEELRRSSSNLITRQDVLSVDSFLISYATKLRRERPVIVASHPVTREQYGFRAIPFSPSMLLRIAPTAVCMLICSSETVNRRVGRNAEGRPLLAKNQVATHASIQGAIAAIYGFSLGVPMFFLESEKGPAGPARVLIRLLRGES
jgi:adenylate kinase